MARVNNLSDFLADVADAIRTKKETTEQIPAENFDQEILSIETGIDTSDATATTNDILKDKTAYVNNTKLTGTIQTLTKDDAPYMLPTTHPSYSSYGSSTLVSNAPEYGDYLYLTNGNYGNVGYVIEFPINVLPVDIRGKNILIRYFKDYIVGYDWIDFCVTEYTNSFKGSYHDGTYSILCVDENGTSANFTYYYYTQQNLTFDSITPDSWTLSTSAPSGKSNKQNGYSYSTKKVISTSNSSLVLIPASEDYKFIVKTNVGTSGLKKYVKDEAVLDTKINTTELAEKAGLTSDKILEGNTILGVEGTAETGTQINNQDKEITENGTYTADEGYTGLGTVTVNVPQTGDVPVKLFATIEEMQADPEAKEGDLALVYNSEYVPTKTKTTVDTVMFPKTVTLANKVTENITGRVICVDSHRLECNIELTATSYTVQLTNYRGNVTKIVEYMSTDGITYIRKTNLADDMYTFDSEYEWRTSWSNEVLGNFVLTTRKTFNGLFDYRTGLDNNYIELYGNVAVSGYNKYTADIENIKIDKLTEIVHKIENELGAPKLYVVIKNDNGVFLYRYPDAGIPGVIVYGDDYYRISQSYTRDPKSSVDKYTLDLENMTYTKTTLRASSTYEYQTVYETIPKTSFIGILNLTTFSDTLEMFGHNSSSSTSSYPMLNTCRTAINMTYGTFTKYLIADSQLDDIHPSDLLPGKTGYGSLGVVTGDGSMLNAINKSDLIKAMYGENNTIYGPAWNRTLARIYNNIAITNAKLNEMTNNTIVPIKLSAYTSDGLNHISLFDKTTESAYSVFSRDYTKYIEPDVSNSRLCVKDTNTGDIIYSYDMVFDNPFYSDKRPNIINIYDDTYIAWSCTSTVGHVYKFNLHEDNAKHTEIDLGGTYKSYEPFNIFAYNNDKLYLTIKVDTTSGSVCKYELGYINVLDMTYHSILSKSVNYYGTAYGWSANITSNKDILVYFNISKDSSSGSSKYWGYLIDSEDNILKSVEKSSTTLNAVHISHAYPNSQRILYDNGTYLYASGRGVKINKNTLIATNEASSYPTSSSYDFSYLFDYHNVYTGENYDNVINMPDIYVGYIYYFDGGSGFVQSAMPSGNGFIWGLENRCASLRGSYDFTISTFDNYDMLLVRPFAANGDTELAQYMFIDKTQYKNTISPTEYNAAVATTEDILGNTTE